MNRISSGQLTCILLLSEAFMIMCLSADTGLPAMAGTAIGFGIKLLLCIPAMVLYKNGFSLSSYCKERHFVLPVIFVLYFIARGGISFVLIWNSAEQLSLPYSGSLITAVLIGIVCLYTSSLGLRTFSRAATFTAGFLGITLVILLIGAWQRMDISSISLAESSGAFSGAVENLMLSDSLPVFFVLMSFTREDRPAKRLMFLPIGLLLWEIVQLLCAAVLGGLASYGEYPFFLLTSVSQPLAAQRADAIYLIVFVLLCTLRITMFTVLSAHIMGTIFPRLKLRSIIALLLMIGAGTLFGFIGYTGSPFCILPIVFLTFTVPLWLLIKKKKECRAS